METVINCNNGTMSLQVILIQRKTLKKSSKFNANHGVNFNLLENLRLC